MGWAEGDGEWREGLGTEGGTETPASNAFLTSFTGLQGFARWPSILLTLATH